MNANAHNLVVLKRYFHEIDNLYEIGLRSRSSEFIRWLQNTNIAITRIFGPGHQNEERFGNISFEALDLYNRPSNDDLHAYRNGLRTAAGLLLSMIDQLSLHEELQPSANSQTSSQAVSRKIFVVHGHDEGARDKVARFLSSMDFEPVILNEKPNQGKMILEKLEVHSDCTFAVVLVTGDDEGREIPQSDEEKQTLNNLRPRARQNVIFEMGYLLGRLKRERVCVLIKGEVELLSDIDGFVYTSFDQYGGWKRDIAKELHAAGFEISKEKYLGS